MLDWSIEFASRRRSGMPHHDGDLIDIFGGQNLQQMVVVGVPIEWAPIQYWPIGFILSRDETGRGEGVGEKKGGSPHFVGIREPCVWIVGFL